MVSGAAVIAVTYGLARYGYGLYLPQFRAAFGLSPGAAGAIAAGGYVGYCGAAVVASRLVGGGRARRALWAAGGSAALGSILVAAAWDGASLATGALIAGSGAGAATPALVAAVAHTIPLPDQPRAQGLVNGGTGAGVVGGGLLVLSVPEAWRWSWAGFAVVSLLVTACADRRTRWRSVPEGPAGRGGTDPDERALAPRLGRPLVAALLAGAGCAGVWTFARDLMTADGGLPPAVTGLLWCLLGAAGLLGGLSGVLVRRVGLRVAWRTTVLAAAAGTVLLGALPGAVVPAAIALACFGSAFVALSGVLLAWGAQRVPAAAAGATAVLFIGLTVGQAVGAVALGVLSEAAGTLTAFLAAGTLLVVSAAAAERRQGR
ncbi:MFS transporter [Geodermatophilus sabuli]|uniref:Predicted arabinose efflux permease, MFS family n=1 Tax=Geodermatophilus sabuli TaxID=1564158 RepID=A0A285E9W4_9ACTN|nr:MFS transporter [Geodermatophilus sabuli]MBB3085662.1 putative MFS family arabinose efflux permease [Geodermatophilus sabuli]SNX95919.1 Predicted arabinose efflux permease, MFS family [Geodermatophilus sabuli]